MDGFDQITSANSALFETIFTAQSSCIGESTATVLCDATKQNMNNTDEFGFFPWLNENKGTAYNKMPPKRTAKSDKKENSSRKTFSQAVQDDLELEFRVSPYLTTWKRQYLSEKLKLTERQVRVWFQNRRMRIKNEQRNKRRAEELQNTTHNKCTGVAPNYAAVYPSFPLSSPTNVCSYQSTFPEINYPATDYHSASLNHNRDNYHGMNHPAINLSYYHQPPTIQQTDGKYQYCIAQNPQPIVKMSEMPPYTSYPVIHTNNHCVNSHPYYNNSSSAHVTSSTSNYNSR